MGEGPPSLSSARWYHPPIGREIIFVSHVSFIASTLMVFLSELYNAVWAQTSVKDDANLQHDR